VLLKGPKEIQITGALYRQLE